MQEDYSKGKELHNGRERVTEEKDERVSIWGESTEIKFRSVARLSSSKTKNFIIIIIIIIIEIVHEVHS